MLTYQALTKHIKYLRETFDILPITWVKRHAYISVYDLHEDLAVNT